MNRTLQVWLLVAFTGAFSRADTFHVDTNSPSDGPGTSWSNAFHTIQGAVNAAGNGDTVLVTNGIYTLDHPLDISASIVLTSACGAAETIIDGNHTTRCIQVSATGVVIDGFTVCNGAGPNVGGGILFLQTGCLANSIIISNSAIGTNKTFGPATLGQGGGLYFATNGTVENCSVLDNFAHGGLSASMFAGIGAGGGIYAAAGGLLLLRCDISRNTAIGQDSGNGESAPGGLGLGGGVYSLGTLNCSNCSFRSNVVHGGTSDSGFGGAGGDGRGGGIYAATGGVILSACELFRNRAEGAGPKWKSAPGAGLGGGVCSLGSLSCMDCRILENSATGGDCAYRVSGNNGAGAGVYALGDTLVARSRITGNLAAGGHGGYGMDIVGNGGNARGGGLYLERNFCLLNCEISGNGAVGGTSGDFYGSAERGGAGGVACGGVFAGAGGAGTVSLCTIAGNSGIRGEAGLKGTVGYGAGGLWWNTSGFVTNTIISGNAGSDEANVYTTSGTQSYDYCCLQPLVAGNGNIGDAPLFISPSSGDYRLRCNSPCVDHGTNESFMIASRDLAGIPRVVGPVVDMGCFEYSSGTYDSDCDGMIDSIEVEVGTDPADASSVFAIRAVSIPTGTSRSIVFSSAAGHQYSLHCRTNLIMGAWEPVEGCPSVVGDGGLQSLCDTNSARNIFYQISVQ